MMVSPSLLPGHPPMYYPHTALHVPCHTLLIGQHKTLARLDKVFLTSWHSDNSPLCLWGIVVISSSSQDVIICCCQHWPISSDQPPVWAGFTHWPLPWSVSTVHSLSESGPGRETCTAVAQLAAPHEGSTACCMVTQEQATLNVATMSQISIDVTRVVHDLEIIKLCFIDANRKITWDFCCLKSVYTKCTLCCWRCLQR